MLARMLALKVDAGSGALEQMLLAEYCAPHFTSHVPDFDGPIADHAGRALRSMFIEPANVVTPKGLSRELGLVPDVMILDPTRNTVFPNGRTLTDDVIDIVVDIPLPGGTLPGEGPTFPTMNDVPFLADFPYLAPPH